MSATNLLNGDSSAVHNSNKTDGLTKVNSRSSNHPTIDDASSLDDVRASLAALHMREAAITSRLKALISSQADLSRELGRLDVLRANLGTQVIATRSISNGMLSGAADTAGRLSNRVKELDLEKDRVQQTLRVVEQVAELKACVHGVVGSMGAPQDWEAAAGYIARASKVPEAIVRGGFAASIVPSVEVPDAPWVTLEDAKESLCGLFLREFEKAAGEGDGAKVTRFFKLFPLIGRGDTGLEVYGRYVCQGVAGTARQTLKEVPGGQGRKDGYFYANALTKLFEHIAQIVEGHGGLVERHYGAGKMVKVIERLQMEADVQGGIILDSWSDERGVDRRLTDVKSYPFSFLVQSFVPPAKGMAGTPRMNSPAVGGGTNARSSEDEGVDMKEVDELLREIAVMLGRWSLYSRFLAGKCRTPDTAADAALSLPEVLTNSNLGKKVSTKLGTPYQVMSTFFFRRSVEKAFQLDESPSGLSLSLNKAVDGNPPYIISAVDDVMYMVSTVIERCLSTSQREIVSSVVPTVNRVLSAEFIGVIQRRMQHDCYPKPAIQGGFPPEDKIIAFIVLINSLDVAIEYLDRIISPRLALSDQSNGAPPANPLAASFPFEHDINVVVNSLKGLNSSFSLKANELCTEGVAHLFSNVVDKRLKLTVQETFRDADYALTEEELAEIALQNDEEEEDMLDLVQRQFERGWNALVKPIERIMTPKPFASLMNRIAKELAITLERRVWRYGGKANAYGAIRMERDFSGIISIVAKGNYSMRDLFSRVSQTLMVANMEDDEWDELMAEGEDGIEWVLSDDEMRRARNLVRD
ncbi:COG4 transport protein-domain-containing protein [Truncatella angustata]|uniref:Conserved oligomeric Golgi complex subunit 4 n=1 Tax=Truncatella angustata TaxID=152316 RepID=A0A9P8UEQ0_9PEZI|nr:COG4 transport protein-domain-containing protein [Truncatella angustata]KAH6648586.1 COG4 transport protein-domain-containing protein [Truncatella angustata]